MSDLIAVPPRLLDQAGEDLVKRLGGRWDARRAQGLCLCPAHADRSPSLSVRVGDKALLFHCFAGCKRAAIVHALRRLDPLALQHGVSMATRGSQINPQWLMSRIDGLWEGAGDTSDTPAALYLGRRSLPPRNPALRFATHAPLGSGRALHFRPALIAAVREGARLVAIQRIFLDPDHGRQARDLARPKRMLGRPGRGAVRLAPAGNLLGIAEGMESAFSAMQLLGFPVWASLGAERLARIEIPLSVRHLVLLADNDRAGRVAVAEASNAHAMDGRTIEIMWPWHGLNDWNDVIRKTGTRISAAA